MHIDTIMDLIVDRLKLLDKRVNHNLNSKNEPVGIMEYEIKKKIHITCPHCEKAIESEIEIELEIEGKNKNKKTDEKKSKAKKSKAKKSKPKKSKPKKSKKS